jgi:hypothetical protein
MEAVTIPLADWDIPGADTAAGAALLSVESITAVMTVLRRAEENMAELRRGWVENLQEFEAGRFVGEGLAYIRTRAPCPDHLSGQVVQCVTSADVDLCHTIHHGRKREC